MYTAITEVVMAKQTLPPHYGSGVSGDYFWPRPDIVEPLAASLADGQSHKMFGLRRIGKSSVMLEVKRLLEERKVVVAHVDVQDLNGLHALLRDLLRNLPDQKFRTKLLGGLEETRRMSQSVVTTIKNMIGTTPTLIAVDEERDLLAYWGSVSEHFAEALKNYGQPVVLLIDEFPFLCENLLLREGGREMLVKLLAALRQWRSLPNVGMLITGSIGMRGMVYRHGLNSAHLNDMMMVQVRPMAEPDARAMLGALVSHAKLDWWTEPVTDAIVRNVSALYPSFIQYAFNSVKSRRAISVEEVHVIFTQEIVPGLSQDFFHQFRSRLKRYDSAQRPALEHAVHIVAQAEAAGGLAIDPFYDALEQAFPDQDGEDLLEILVEDGFLLSDMAGNVIRVASPLVTIWAASRPRRRRRTG